MLPTDSGSDSAPQCPSYLTSKRKKVIAHETDTVGPKIYIIIVIEKYNELSDNWWQTNATHFDSGSMEKLFVANI